MSNYDVTIFPTYEQQARFQQNLARATASACLGKRFHTLRTYIQELWNIFGDDRSIITYMEMKVLIQRVCSDMEKEAAEQGQGYFNSPSSVERLLTNHEAFGTLYRYAAPDARTELPENMVDSERDVLASCTRFFAELEKRRRITLDQAKLVLAERMPKSVRSQNVLIEGIHFIEDETCRLFAEPVFGNAEFSHLIEPASLEVKAAPENLDVAFCFSSGAYATPLIISRKVDELVSSGAKRIVVTSPDPASLFESLASSMEKRGISVSMQAKAPFTALEMGRFLIQTCLLSLDELSSPLQASEVAQSAQSGISARNARSLDERVRGDLLASFPELCEQLKIDSKRMEHLIALMRHEDNRAIFRTMRLWLRKAEQPQSWRQGQERCIDLFARYMDACNEFNMPYKSCLDTLGSAKMSISVKTTVSQPCATVSILAQAQAALLDPKSIDALLMSDMTESCYPIRLRTTAADLLLEKLGFVTHDRTLGMARNTFNTLLELPMQSLVFHRRLNNSDAEEENPALVLEEFVDCYRADPTASDDIDNIYRLPERFLAGITSESEDAFDTSTASDLGENRKICELPTADNTRIADTRHLILPRRHDNELLEGVILSPSRLDAYAKCPHRWFVEQRLGVNGIDESLDALAKGSFIHETLQRFYPAYTEATGHRKLQPEDVELAQHILKDIARDILAEQPKREPGNNRIIPRTPQERAAVHDLIAQAQQFLATEAKLLPTFTPTYFEYEIPPHEAVEYAGIKINGKVDRIDIDNEGRAVIIDYKGSLGKEYELASFLEGGGSLQTYIYASIIQRKLGLDVVGTLYISYKRRGGISGAYDSSMLETPHLPGIRKTCGFVPTADLRSFQELLDSAEEVCRELVGRMLTGNVEPTPGPGCSFCPKTTCPERM